jgi:6-phosphogluconolactonase
LEMTNKHLAPLLRGEVAAKRRVRGLLFSSMLLQSVGVKRHFNKVQTPATAPHIEAHMNIDILPDTDSAARRAASIIADAARAAVSARGKFVFAVSGGTTPWQMLRHLSGEDVPWGAIHIAQVDERVAPDGHPDRNLTHLRESLLTHASIKPEQILAMPVTVADLAAGASSYVQTLGGVAGSPIILDLVHLGLGPDGHTASLVPGDPVLDITDRDVAITGEYQGHRRMTLTYPALNRARKVLWLVTGAGKAGMLVRLKSADPSIPAGRVRQENAVVVADKDAAREIAH